MNTFSDLQQINPDLQFIPITEKKFPMVKEWEKTRTVYDFSKAYGIGLVCGSISKNTEAIDVDCKYDLTGTLFERLKTSINAANKEILKKLVVQKTMSNGYHLIYNCQKIEGNLKLARRPTIEAEKEQTFKRTLAKAKIDSETKPELKINPQEVALKAAENDKVRVLIETRGDRGFIAIAPTRGYELIHGDLSKIETLTIEERNTLFTVCRSFNELVSEYKPVERREKKQIKGLTSFEDYNNRADVVALLEKNGWQVVGRKGSKTLVLRPGDTSSASSGNYDESKNWFTVFSTSTEFEPETAYLPYAVFAFLECKKDFSEASKRLYDLGYGDRIEKTIENNSTTPSRIDLLSEDFSFVANENDFGDYLNKWRKGTFEMGLSTGFKPLDKHFLFKRTNLVVVNGHDNVGKSTVIWYLAILSAILHNWRWIIFSSENSVGNVIRKLIEFYWCEPISAMSEEKFQIAKTFVIKHFSILKSDDDLYNYKDVLNMSKKLLNKSKYDGLMIDPYNSLKIELTSASKLSTHEYHYEAISEMKLFGKQNDCCVYVNCHAVTSALRTLGSDGFPQAPQKADTEGGGKFSNKADDFITIHRKVQSPNEWMYSELHIRKIKETETGGHTTPFNEPVKIKMVKGLVGFEYEYDDQIVINPVLSFHQDQKELQRTIKQKDFRPIIDQTISLSEFEGF